MAERFEDLGIAPDLATGAASMGWEAPVALQRDAIPVIRRGNNLVVHASAGAGATGAYGLGVLDRLLQREDEEDGSRPDGPQALVLVPDADTASATAGSLARLAADTRLPVRALAPGWAPEGAAVLVTSPTAAAAGLRDSSLKLGDLLALVIAGADLLAGTTQWDDLETLIDAIPGAAQRVMVTGRVGGDVDDFAERHVRRAMTVPARHVDGEEPVAPEGSAVGYAVVPEGRKLAAASFLLRSLDATEVAVVCRSPRRAERVGRGLAARGVPVDAVPDSAVGDRKVLVLPRLEADRRSTRAAVLSFDVPFDAEELRDLHGAGGAILVTPREREHLIRIASRAGIPLRPETVPEPAALTPAEAFRDRLRAVLAEGELAAELALVEPLLEEFTAAEVAAAAIRAARRSDSWRGTEGRDGGQAGGPGATRGAAPPPPAETWVHLFMTVGSRDGIGPGDVVGAMTGEAGVGAEQVGKIDIRESHTTVEVATAVAPRVIEALNGRSLKGRSLRVDYDRKERPPRKPSGRDRRPGSGGSGGRGSGSRGPTRRPGRGGGGGRGGGQGRGPSGGTRRG